jgi:hypothetical protein
MGTVHRSDWSKSGHGVGTVNQSILTQSARGKVKRPLFGGLPPLRDARGRASQHAPWERRSVNAAVNHGHAVDDHMGDARRIAPRLIERGPQPAAVDAPHDGGAAARRRGGAKG